MQFEDLDVDFLTDCLTSIFLLKVFLLFISVITVYSKNKQLIQFNTIKLNKSELITEELLFDYITYYFKVKLIVFIKI